MKRDMDLVRYILLTVEKAQGSVDIELLEKGRWNHDMVAYHVELLSAHGLIDCKTYSDAFGDVVDGSVTGLTWDGCDYLDAIRSKTVWERTKQVIRDSVGSTTMDVVKQTAVLVATQAVKAQLGIAS